MPEYTFENLSSFDFELLVRDLLQEELGIRLSTFKSGRDRGIDIRFSTTGGTNKLIVQCKHYAASGYSTLMRDLKLKELPKVESLRPQQYLLVTSVGLTPDNQESIALLFAPFCRSAGDVLGREDINNLLRRHPTVEKKNFKLWLTSTAVLERVFQSSTFAQTEVEIERIRRRTQYYVQNESYFRAKDVLEDQHYCIIAGNPGIGKTTLAEILVLDYIDQGYEFVRIASDISEGFSLLKPDTQQIFYYDDFLGQTSLDYKFNKNEEDGLIRFAEAVKNGKGRLVMTTREYILNQAKLNYERLDRSNLDLNKCVINVADYSKLHRAQILFNHLYFSNLPSEFKLAMVENFRYREIINHRNYNPRIIEWMTDLVRLKGIAAKDYPDVFLATLTDPSALWTHIYENQLSDAGRQLLLVLASLPHPITIDDLERGFVALQRDQQSRFGIRSSLLDFRRAQKELEGNFIITDVSGPTLNVRFHNPSVRDFLEQYLAKTEAVLTSVLESSIFFAQISTLWNMANSPTGSRTVRDRLTASGATTTRTMMRLLDSADPCARIYLIKDHRPFIVPHRISYEARVRLIFAANKHAPSTSSEELGTPLADLLARVQQRSADRADLVTLLLDLEKGAQWSEELRSQIIAASAEFLSAASDLDEYLEFARFARAWGGEFDPFWKEKAVEELDTYLYSEVDSWIDNEEDPGTLRDYIEKLGTLSDSM
jgi:hypothetical protein